MRETMFGKRNHNMLVIIGASGHGKVVADIAAKMGYADIVFLDDNPEIKTNCGYNVAGGTAEAISYRNRADVFIAIGNAEIRKNIQQDLERQEFDIPVLIHPNAVIAESVSIGQGSVVMAGAVINAESRIGKGCIVNTGASVDHDCVISDYVHISVGAHIAGTVTIGEKTWVGIGAVVSNNVLVYEECMIGAGAVVIHDICEGGTYVGIPAKRMEDKNDEDCDYCK